MNNCDKFAQNVYDCDDICALATPQGHGAIAIIRTSGAESISKISRIFKTISRGGDSSVLELNNPKQGSELRSLLETKPYTMRYGAIYNGGKLLDEVLVAVFKAPHSYTGENSAEIYCHGSSYIVSEIIRILLSNGFTMAEPGEFSKRAFLNGKMDLAQTEAVADLISSETSSAHAVAMQQMKGGFSEELKQMRSALLEIVSLMELELDFSEEEVEFADRSKLKNLLASVTAKVDSLISSFALGNVIKNGVPVAIVGATNTGKSTLLNAICGEERAIGSDIHGTTRDAIESNVNIGGTMFRFIDTAGIRETKDTIEVIGIERTYSKLREASIVVMMLDVTKPDSFEDNLQDLAKRVDTLRQKIVIVVNKADAVDDHFKTLHSQIMADIARGNEVHCGCAGHSEDHASHSANSIAKDYAQAGDVANSIAEDHVQTGPATNSDNEDGHAQTGRCTERCSCQAYKAIITEADVNNAFYLYSKELAEEIKTVQEICSRLFKTSPSILPVSAKQKLAITELKNLLIKLQNTQKINTGDTIVTNLRHYQALKDASAALLRTSEALKSGTPTDLVAEEIRNAIYHIGTIVGEITTDEVLGNIFKNFCIGK